MTIIVYYYSMNTYFNVINSEFLWATSPGLLCLTANGQQLLREGVEATNVIHSNLPNNDWKSLASPQRALAQ